MLIYTAMTDSREIQAIVYGKMTAESIKEGDLEAARSSLSKIQEVVRTLPEEQRRGPIMASLMRIWQCGQVDFCQEALNAMSEQVPLDKATLDGIFGSSLEYLRRDKDEWFLRALQPGTRMAVGHLIQAFEGQPVGSPLEQPQTEVLG